MKNTIDRQRIGNLLWEMRKTGQAGNKAQVLKIAQYIIEIYPECYVARRLAAYAAYHLKQINLAINLATFGLLLKPEDAGMLILSAQIALDKHNVEQAEKYAYEVMQIAPHRVAAIQIMADVYSITGKIGSAITLMENVIIRKPKDGIAHVKLAELCQKAGRSERGLQVLEALVHPPLLLRSELLAKTERIPEAVECCDRILNTGNGSYSDELIHKVINNKISWLEKIGDSLTLTQMADQIQSQSNFNSRTKLHLAEVLLGMGNINHSLRLARSCRSDMSALPHCMAIIAAVAYISDRKKLANRCLSYLGKKDSIMFAQVMRYSIMGRLIRKQSSPVKSGSDPDQSVLKLMLEQSIKTLSKKARQNPGYADIRYHMANCLAGLGRETEAAIEVKQALKINPRYNSAIKLSERMLKMAI